MIPLLRLVNFFSILMLSFSILAIPPKTFTQAKKQARVLFTFQRETLYCKCKFDARIQVDLKSCNMKSAAKLKRAQRMEWEHMMPAENFCNIYEPSLIAS